MTSGLRVFLGLGSNMGDRRTLIDKAVDALPDVVAVSHLYETAPIGGPEQPPFLNLVVELGTSLGPYDVLELARSLEAAAERVRTVRWGPRTLDVDVLLYGDLELDDPELTVPHPRMWERRFVLEPLADVAPELMPPGWRATVADQEITDLGPYEGMGS